MPEIYRALIVVLVLHGATFVLMRKPAIAMGMAAADYDRRRNCWLAVTVLVFISPSFWVAMAAVAVVALYGRQGERNPVALYTMLVLALPLISKEISGIGPIEHFLSLDHSRVLALVLLLPAALGLLGTRRSAAPALGSLPADKALLGFYGVLLVLNALVATPMGTARVGVVYPILDVLLLYFVASRTLTDPSRLADFKAAVVTAAALLASVAVFEFFKRWLLYSTLDQSLGAQWGMGNYIFRNDAFLRAIATTGQPIVLGYVMMIAIGFFASRAGALPRGQRLSLGAVLAAGIVAAMSRGPWIGCAAMLLTYIALGRAGGRNLVGTGALIVVIGAVLAATPQGRAVLAYLPFVGGVEAGGVTYREQVFQVSLQVLMDRPLFGAFDYLNDPRMEQLRQGEGIIDIVNTYVGVALATGFVGLSLFGAAFAFPMLKLLTIEQKRHSSGAEPSAEPARAVLATLVGVLVTLGTVSSVTVIPHLYWLLLGSAVAVGLTASSSTPLHTRFVSTSGPIRASRTAVTR